jgi:hypothetical protein
MSRKRRSYSAALFQGERGKRLEGLELARLEAFEALAGRFGVGVSRGRWRGWTLLVFATLDRSGFTAAEARTNGRRSVDRALDGGDKFDSDGSGVVDAPFLAWSTRADMSQRKFLLEMDAARCAARAAGWRRGGLSRVDDLWWPLSTVGGWTLAHAAAARGSLPRGFDMESPDRGGLADRLGNTVAEAAADTDKWLAGKPDWYRRPCYAWDPEIRLETLEKFLGLKGKEE